MRSRMRRSAWILAFLLSLCAWPNLAAGQTRPLVVGLFQSRSPFTVVGGVGTVVVNPFQCEAVRTWPHVGQESREVATPFIAHVDAAPAVVVVVAVARVQAPIFSRGPHHVFMRAVPSACGSMSGGLARSSGTPETSTAFRQAVSQARSDHFTSCAAVAPTQPERLIVSPASRNLPHYTQCSETAA